MNFFDAAIYDLMFKLSGRGMTIFMTFISHLGSAIPLILITIGLLIFSKGKGYSKFIAFNLGASFVINQILKLIIRRPRPELVKFVVEKGYSFPSGHAMVSTVFYGFFIYLISKKVKDKKKKKIYISIIALLILLIGISRIYLGVHYSTDVIAGHIFGVLYLYFAIKYLYKEKQKKNN